MIKTRAKRYVRSVNAPIFEITPRLVRVLKDICNYPLIRQDQLAERHPDISKHALKSIIFNLFHAGFIAKPRQQAELHNGVPGSLPMYLSPDRKGVQLYSLFFADPLPTPKFTQDNDRGRWSYIKHQHTTSTIAMQFQSGAASIPGLSHLTQSELWLRYAPADRLNAPCYKPDNFSRLMSVDLLADPGRYSSMRSDPVPLKLTSRIEWDIKLPGSSGLSSVTLPVSTEPDEWLGRTVNGITRVSFVESDEGTETILPGREARQSMRLFFDTSLYQKLLIYGAAFRHRAHVKQFGISAFDVIIITSTPTRADNIVKLLEPPLRRHFDIHPNFVRVVDRESITRHGNNPYHPDLRYLNLDGSETCLLR